MAPLRHYALVLATAHAHYVWQTTSGAETTVAFSENGLPGNKNILSAIVNITTGRVAPVSGAPASSLTFTQRDAVLAAPVNENPAAIEAAAPYGLHTIAGVPVFLNYYASAPRVMPLVGLSQVRPLVAAWIARTPPEGRAGILS